MAESEVENGLSKEAIEAVRQWRQGDYTLDFPAFPSGQLDEKGYDAEMEEVAGWVVISQTCDIVNIGKGDRHHVVVAPLVKLENEKKLEDTNVGATPSTAPLEHPPSPQHVVDLTMATTIQKVTLAKLNRHDGFSTEIGRAKFGRRLERRYGRFAFPDALNPTLGAIRDQAKSKHNKGSDPGRVYRSIYGFRVAASPSFDVENPTIRIIVVLEDQDAMEATRAEIIAELIALEDAPKFKWPAAFTKASPLFVANNRDEITARQWELSMPVDLDYLSEPPMPESGSEPGDAV
ncbi:hypothetical protein ELI56_15345 [Rhizobium ruizarguesonis]|uniref:hypothetical protein n=1 Tax=Rhizobium ruizarguesonis TaxID=2081791 RepID=UPI00035E9ED8|nr:hypothetical protein [Rhizobium ruizarguesonis]TAT79487.1 hypothetical protein ELI56_15345 [Rhizobium ruizarguesonis]